jgi:serine/threonine-protein kinase RsbW
MSDDTSADLRPDEGQKLIQLNLTIPGEVKAIDPVVEKIMWVVEQMKCAEGKEFEVETALREALANAVVHGCGEDPKKRVQFIVACNAKQGMTIIVRDPGRGFDPEKVPNPVERDRLYSVHGRGIYLINQLMDEVRFEKGGSEIHMKKD